MTKRALNLDGVPAPPEPAYERVHERRYGRITASMWRAHGFAKAGCRVLLNGVDVTDACVELDDVAGWVSVMIAKHLPPPHSHEIKSGIVEVTPGTMTTPAAEQAQFNVQLMSYWGTQQNLQSSSYMMTNTYNWVTSELTGYWDGPALSSTVAPPVETVALNPTNQQQAPGLGAQCVSCGSWWDKTWTLFYQDGRTAKYCQMCKDSKPHTWGSVWVAPDGTAVNCVNYEAAYGAGGGGNSGGSSLTFTLHNEGQPVTDALEDLVATANPNRALCSTCHKMKLKEELRRVKFASKSGEEICCLPCLEDDVRIVKDWKYLL
jgi:hypothetical protein